MPTISAPTASDLLRVAIEQGDVSFADLERETGVSRTNIRGFLNADTSMRMDVADRLFAFLFSGLSGTLNPRRSVMVRTLPIPSGNAGREFDEVRRFISSQLTEPTIIEKRREGSISWNSLEGDWVRKTLYKLSYLGEGDFFFGVRREFAPAISGAGRLIHQFVPQPVDFVGMYVTNNEPSKASIRQLIQEARAS